MTFVSFFIQMILTKLQKGIGSVRRENQFLQYMKPNLFERTMK
jgi:hypothetical protein